MEQTLCEFCFGCNRLENKYFKGAKHCSNFIPAYPDWHEKYIKKIKGEKR